MKILAFDIATNTGWAVAEGGKILTCGTETLATKAEVTSWGKRRLDRRRDPRFERLRSFAEQLCAKTAPLRVVVWEDVEFSSGRKQTQLWASLRSALWAAIPPHITPDCVNVTRLKQFATGNPQATKVEMMFALEQKYPDQFRVIEHDRKPFILHLATGAVCDDNAADAAHVAFWAHKTYGQ